MLGHMSMEGTGLHLAQERRQRPGGDALAPVVPSNPVADFSQAVLFKAHDVADHMPVEDDGLLGDSLVSQDPGPVRRERIPVPGGDAGHRVRLGVQLMFEENREVILCHVPQQKIARQRAGSAVTARSEREPSAGSGGRLYTSSSNQSRAGAQLSATPHRSANLSTR